MINSVQNSYGIKKQFGNNEFPETVNSYWISSEKPEAEDSIEISENNKIIITPKEARKTNNFAKIGISIAGAMVFTAATIFFILKGGPKGFSKAIRNTMNYFETKLAESKLRADNAQSKTTIYMSKLFSNILKRTEAVNNYSTIKDLAFKRMMGITKFTSKIHNGITNLFMKIGRRAVKNSYSDALAELSEATELARRTIANNMTNVDKQIEINGLKHTKLEWLNRLINLNSNLENVHNNGFSSTATNKRYIYLAKKVMPELANKFGKVRSIFTPDNITQFAAENAISGERNILKKQIAAERRAISYTIGNLSDDANSLILDIAKLLNRKNGGNISELGTIRTMIKQYIKTGANNPELKQKIVLSIEEFEKGIDTKGEFSTSVLGKTNELKMVLGDYKQGVLEEILTVSKEVFEPKEYKKLEKLYSKYLRKTDKAIRIETEDFVSKLRDLTMGSAPTDVLTMLGSLTVLGCELAKSKDSDQRQSIALKYGFPALSGIGVSLYCNAKLFAGSKALFFGLLSTFALNRAGEWLDKELKSVKTKLNALNPAKE